MPATPRRRPCALHRHAVAAAAVAALLGLPLLPAHAQYYSHSGAVDPLIQAVDPAVASFNATGSTLSVGNGAAGSFSALAGAQLVAGGLSFANGGLGSATGTFDGGGTVVQLTGTNNRLEVGNWGSGSLLISNGALLDATANATACAAPGTFCNNFIGNGAGSTATLTIDGSGSELRTLRAFVVGAAGVFTQAANGFNFGTPGGSTHATLNITGGGTLRTDGATVSAGPSGGAPTGSERTVASVLVDGTGSRWIIAPDRFSGGNAFLNASTHAHAQSSFTVSHGGQLIVDGLSAGTGASFQLGSAGDATLDITSGGQVIVQGVANGNTNSNANGTNMTIGGGYAVGSSVTVGGAGSLLSVTGAHANLTVGAAGLGGALTVNSGGSVVSGKLQIGAGATLGGYVVVNGGGISLNGTDGRLIVGDWGGRASSILIANGGVVDATLDPAACVGNWCGNVVANRAGASGQLTVSGAGSELRTLRAFNSAHTYVDAFSGTPGGTSSASIQVLDSGTLRTQNTALGTYGGGPLASTTEQSFTDVLIDGVGSRWLVTPNQVDGGDASFTASTHTLANSTIVVRNGGLLSIDGAGGGVGANLNIAGEGQASLTVLSGGKVRADAGSGGPGQSHMNIGQGFGSSGIVTVADAGSLLALTGRVANLDVGAGLGATGVLNVQNAGTVTTGGLNVGAGRGTGSMLVDGGSVEINNGVNGRLFVGSNGNGSLARIFHGGEAVRVAGALVWPKSSIPPPRPAIWALW